MVNGWWDFLLNNLSIIYGQKNNKLVLFYLPNGSSMHTYTNKHKTTSNTQLNLYFSLSHYTYIHLQIIASLSEILSY